jgi:hypothetical protein
MQLSDFISLFNVLVMVLFSTHLLFSFRGNKLMWIDGGIVSKANNKTSF